MIQDVEYAYEQLHDGLWYFGYWFHDSFETDDLGWPTRHHARAANLARAYGTGKSWLRFKNAILKAKEGV